ncbi:MAG: cation transporter [Synergistaceae bacterium]|nr:cation transporter [Synergistaceae bacterium]
MKHELLEVPDMMCPACAKGIEKIVAGMPGVAKASVSFFDQTIAIKYDDRRLSAQMLRDIIAGVAHSVVEDNRRISATIPITGIDSAECAERIEKTLATREGIINAAIDFHLERARIIYDPRKINFKNIKTTLLAAVFRYNT